MKSGYTSYNRDVYVTGDRLEGNRDPRLGLRSCLVTMTEDEKGGDKVTCGGEATAATEVISSKAAAVICCGGRSSFQRLRLLCFWSKSVEKTNGKERGPMVAEIYGCGLSSL